MLRQKLRFFTNSVQFWRDCVNCSISSGTRCGPLLLCVQKCSSAYFGCHYWSFELLLPSYKLKAVKPFSSSTRRFHPDSCRSLDIFSFSKWSCRKIPDHFPFPFCSVWTQEAVLTMSTCPNGLTDNSKTQFCGFPRNESPNKHFNQKHRV